MTGATGTLDNAQIAAVRAFNRRYTRLIGVLEEHLLDSDFTLTEARILFELARSGPMAVRTLRTDLGLDPGYLSRLLARFETSGLLERQRSDADGRCLRAALTEAGRAAAADLDRRSTRGIAELLEGHSAADRDRLVAAMRAIEGLLDPEPAPTRVRLRAPEPGDYGWIVQRNAALYAAEYGWDVGYEALVAKIVAEFLGDHDPRAERAWIAEADGVAVGAVFCVREDATTARLRLLLVEPSARGLGVGTALVEQCLRFATEAGYDDIVLWTNDVLTAARRIYRRAGFELVESRPHHSFGADLVGQTWRRGLR
ncbi:bifunctional helix-turn-helix transcriptional regulator/GNAT family N-acetyltransferase [Nocardia spumae]|uniref:bifunctional helix-turn-helix transcriptional regulator/GNAT family N-acetyltransferase n=1 Tax=Nocardia spumae TaxID=2887190 RepID=UPI001D13F1DF|nr:bifunctional helix-turn-helix transcriptional regulator/GNAT family N-acetyltransferase [Nocardia spumae]